MSARDMPARAQGRPAKRVSSVNSARSANPATGPIAAPSRVQTPKLQPTNGDVVFDAKAFLARAGVGKRILNLKKNDTAFAQGDPSDAMFYVQKGKLRVTVTSANGKEATITLVGEGEFLGRTAWFPLILFDSRRPPQ